MRKKQCIAMLLAGGQGSRLGILTQKLAKPAVPFGGKYRIIDFALSNCSNSGIDTVGVLTQYQPLTLNTYIGIGSAWDLDRKNGGVTVLPPYVRAKGGEWYRGTANAVYQNIDFIESYNPEYVLILSGDHIYKMDYSRMLEYHRSKKAVGTIAVIEVSLKEASRFGIMNTDADQRIVEFEEKPAEPKSNLASMGVYIFSWPQLRTYLEEDEADRNSSNDFGKDIIPKMLAKGERLFAYPFRGYWKDVGTIESLWEANMDLLGESPQLNLHDRSWRIYAVNPTQPAHYLSDESQVKCSLVNEGCFVRGEVIHSVLFPGVYVGKDAKIRDSVLMPNVRVEDGAVVEKAIVGENTVIGPHCHIGAEEGEAWMAVDFKNSGITVIAEDLLIPGHSSVKKGAIVNNADWKRSAVEELA